MDNNIGMTVWLANSLTILTVTSAPTMTLTAYFKPRGSTVNFTKLNAEFVYRNDNVWELQTQFDIGEYYVKVVIDEQQIKNVDELMVVIKTVAPEEYSQAIATALIRSDIEAAKNAISQRSSLKPIG